MANEAISPHAQIDAWNAAHPLGTPVRYWRGERQGEGRVGRTRSKAFLFGAGDAVIFVENYSSFVALSHVEPLPDPAEWDSSPSGTQSRLRRAVRRAGSAPWRLYELMEGQIPRRVVGDYLAGRTALDVPAHAAALGAALGVSPRWLIDGAVGDAAKKTIETLRADPGFARLEPRDQQAICEMIEMMPSRMEVFDGA